MINSPLVIFYESSSVIVRARRKNLWLLNVSRRLGLQSSLRQMTAAAAAASVTAASSSGRLSLFLSFSLSLSVSLCLSLLKRALWSKKWRQYDFVRNRNTVLSVESSFFTTFHSLTSLKSFASDSLTLLKFWQHWLTVSSRPVSYKEASFAPSPQEVIGAALRVFVVVRHSIRLIL